MILTANKALEAAETAIAGLKWEDGKNIAKYTEALAGLDKQQRAIVMSRAQLGQEEQAAIEASIRALQNKIIVQAAEKAGVDADTLAQNLNLGAMKNVTRATLDAALADKGYTDAQKEQIISSVLLYTKNETLSFSFQKLAANAKAAAVAMLHNPLAWVMAGVAAIFALVRAYENAKERAKEAAQEMESAAQKANEQSKSLSDLIAQYRKLATAGDFDSSARETAKNIQEQITNLVGEQAGNLDLVNGKLDEEIEKLNEIAYQNVSTIVQGLTPHTVTQRSNMSLESMREIPGQMRLVL